MTPEDTQFLAQQALHEPHDSCRGAGDPDYHTEADYLDPIDAEVTDTQ